MLLNILPCCDRFNLTGSETNVDVIGFVPEAIADFRTQELIGNDATAYRS
jgi:hypothetical protein